MRMTRVQRHRNSRSLIDSLPSRIQQRGLRKLGADIVPGGSSAAYVASIYPGLELQMYWILYFTELYFNLLPNIWSCRLESQTKCCFYCDATWVLFWSIKVLIYQLMHHDKSRRKKWPGDMANNPIGRSTCTGSVWANDYVRELKSSLNL